ncbi:MAG: Rid family hydrolase [Marinilabiliales bacterium]|nr:Rid family hydrolase [Marinilabiliales bacterium]
MVVGNVVYCSGQIPLNPITGEVSGATIEEQTEQSLKNLFAVLRSAGSGPEKVAKTTVLLSDMDDFKGMNGVYERMFGSHRPTRRGICGKNAPPQRQGRDRGDCHYRLNTISHKKSATGNP